VFALAARLEMEVSTACIGHG